MPEQRKYPFHYAIAKGKLLIRAGKAVKKIQEAGGHTYEAELDIIAVSHRPTVESGTVRSLTSMVEELEAKAKVLRGN